MLDLITDRTAQDVARRAALAKKGWANMSASERADWTSGSAAKGSYNYTDLNRVESAVDYLNKQLLACGYDTGIHDIRTWTAADVPTIGSMTRYLENIRAIREALPIIGTTPPVPASMSNLTYSAANDIEAILQSVEVLVHNMIASFTYCGEVFGGEI